MSTFDYLTPAEAMAYARSEAAEHLRIVGRRGLSADRMPHIITRTNSGYARKPLTPWDAHGHLDKFKVIERVEWAKDAEPGMAEVFYTDGSSDLVGRKDLLCVERPIKLDEQ
jgi:hypothetical protein